MKPPPWLNRNVVGMSVASFFSDLGHEAATSLLPSFLASLGAPPWRTFRVRPAPDAPQRELVSVGVPVPGAELRIADQRGATLDEGRPGRVLVRGPSVMRGYFGRPEATAEALRDGWLDTGDVGLVEGGIDDLRLAPDEVKSVLMVPIQRLLDSDVHTTEIRSVGEQQYRIHYYTFGDDVIWGATGRIVYQFLKAWEEAA